MFRVIFVILYILEVFMRSLFAKLLFVLVFAFFQLDLHGETDFSNVPCEVKFLLDQKVLDSADKTKISAAYKEVFGLNKESAAAIAYIDTENCDFYKEKWINRIRVKGKSRMCEYTFKKRYPIFEENLDSVFEDATAEGLCEENGFSLKIDWELSGMVLDCKYDATLPMLGYGRILFPEISDSVRIAGNIMPEQESNAKKKNWGSRLLKYALYKGPVFALQYKGTFCDKKITIEVWPIENQKTKTVRYLAELSFNENSLEEAKRYRTLIMEKLSEMKVLERDSTLKTRAVFEAYTK